MKILKVCDQIDLSKKLRKIFRLSKISQIAIFVFYTYRNVQENHSHFDGILDLSPRDEANSEPAAT